MVLFWVTIPLMVIAVALAIGFVALPSSRQHRRLQAERKLHGQVPLDEGAVHLAVTVKPGEEAHIDEAIGKAREVAGDLEATPTPEDRQVLVSVPVDADGRQVEEQLVSELSDHEAVEEIRRIERPA